MAGIDAQEFGRLQAQVETLLEANKVNTETLLTMSTAIQTMQLQMAEAKGGWKVLMLMGTATASLGGLGGWVLSNFFGKGPP